MSSKGEKQKDAGKGFAGLLSLVSDVDSVVASARQNTFWQSVASASSGNTIPLSHPSVTEKCDTEHQFYQSSSSAQVGGWSTSKRLLGIGALIGVLWLLSPGPGNKDVTPSSVTGLTVPTAPEANPSPNVDRSLLAPTQALNRLVEEKPPIGTDNVLGLAQIRYCVWEDIRIGAAKGVINEYVEAEIDRFNAMVADYNVRCGQFRYRAGSLESVRSEVEAERLRLESEGVARFRHPTSRNFAAQQNSSGTNASIAVKPARKPNVVPQTEKSRGQVALGELSTPQQLSIELACVSEKFEGPSAYDACVKREISAMSEENGWPD